MLHEAFSQKAAFHVHVQALASQNKLIAVISDYQISITGNLSYLYNNVI